MYFFVDALRHGREVIALIFTYSERMSGLVDSEGKILNFSSPLFTHNSSCLLGRNMLVVKTMGRFRERLLNVRLSQKGSSNIKYEGPTLQILGGVDETQKWTHRVDWPPLGTPDSVAAPPAAEYRVLLKKAATEALIRRRG